MAKKTSKKKTSKKKATKSAVARRAAKAGADARDRVRVCKEIERTVIAGDKAKLLLQRMGQRGAAKRMDAALKKIDGILAKCS